MTAPARARIKQGKASLIGGIAVGLASFVLWSAITHELEAGDPVWMGVGLAVSAGIAAWIRVADL